METEQYCISKIKEQGLLPLFYHADPMICIEVVKALYNAGIKVIEFTNRGDQALKNFRLLVEERDKNMPGLLLGVGTIRTPEHASQFIEAGADLLVSPVFDSSVCDIAYMEKILWIPGCMTPTEIQTAASAGCVLIKLFPGNLLGPGFVEAIKPVFAGLDFMVTGGVEAEKENIESWFKAGVCAVGLGSKLITKNILDTKKFELISTKTGELLAIIRQHTL